MKRFNFLSVAIAVVLMITAVSCTTMAGSQDDYYNGSEARTYGNRVYVDDPYRGTVVLERDPRTGRYYEVSPFYDRYYGSRYGSRVYDPYYRSPYYGRRSSGSYRNNSGSNNNQNNQRPAEDDRKTRDEARKKILGN
jgi:hypothetical protein